MGTFIRFWSLDGAKILKFLQKKAKLRAGDPKIWRNRFWGCCPHRDNAGLHPSILFCIRYNVRKNSRPPQNVFFEAEPAYYIPKKKRFTWKSYNTWKSTTSSKVKTCLITSHVVSFTFVSGRMFWQKVLRRSWKLTFILQLLLPSSGLLVSTLRACILFY